jgi:hypothetical protein
VLLATEFGADPNDQIDDTVAIQAAIDAAAESDTNRVFLPAAIASTTGDIPGSYHVSDTIVLGPDTELCGVSRYSSMLDATEWAPSTSSPVVQTVDDAGAATVLADLMIRVSAASGTMQTGYEPQAYALDWQAGRDSIYRDVYTRRNWGDPGDRVNVLVRNNGGGRWYGVTFNGGYQPTNITDGFTDENGELKVSPEARHLLIEGTTEPLTFYPFHCQHMTAPYGTQCEMRGASNVNIYAIKAESASVPAKMKAIIQNNPAQMVPSNIRISNATNVSLIGYEGLSEQAAGRAVIEVIDSTDVTIAQAGRRNGTATEVPEAEWYLVAEQEGTQQVGASAKSFVSLFKTD